MEMTDTIWCLSGWKNKRCEEIKMPGQYSRVFLFLMGRIFAGKRIDQFLSLIHILTVDRKVSEKITHVGIRAHDFHPADASSHDSENKIPVAVDREVRAPFEWTILFRNRENPKENMWMKMEREQTQIPQWVQVDPKRILLLEE